VVGYGDAGAVTAMTAHDEGAEVLILEKQAADKRRPNSRFSGGLFINPTDPDAAAGYFSKLSRINGDLDETDPAVVRTWAVETSKNAEWLKSVGGECFKVVDIGEHTHIEGYESISIWKPDMNDHPNGSGHRGWGWGLFKFLTDQCTARDIEVMYGADVQWLLTNAEGDVIGVRVKHDGHDLNIGAARGVVMTCGGFEFNNWMKLNYLRAVPTHFYGNPENTGDGIRIAMEVGADLWHMNSCAARLVARFPHPGYPGGCPIDLWGVEGTEGIKVLQGEEGVKLAFGGSDDVKLPVAQMETSARGRDLPGALITDRYGRRFTSELYRVHTLYYELLNYDSQYLSYPKIPSWWIFDEQRRSKNPITPTFFSPTGPLQQIPWSPDNMDEVEKGWILTAGSIEELAAKCGMEPSVLAETHRRYNSYCAAGEDPEFGRPASTLTPLDTPPYYAIQLWPGGPNTQGGARRDADARIMRVTGNPVPNLYSAGEFGSVYGMLYPSGGGNIAECLAFGRVAGRNVAHNSAR
jgi:succinate dehydrogenase/fumarate reductase flavoprotein subunit